MPRLRRLRHSECHQRWANEDITLISGIGCSSRIGGYQYCYGAHTTHGRALPFAQGIKCANKDTHMIVCSGDGDSYAIGLGHAMHAMKRNMDITYLVFDNQVYGLTKGQTSPASSQGFVTKTTPDGNPVDLASGAINPYHKAIAVEQITFANVTVTGIVAEGSVGAENTIIQDGTFQKNVKVSGTINGGQFDATVQLDSSNAQILGGVFNNIKLPDYYTLEGTVIRNAVITGSLMADTSSKAAVSNTVSFSPIESQHRAYGQQLSKLIEAYQKNTMQ